MTSHSTINQFNPDWVPPPGATISEMLEDLEWNQVTLAKRLGTTPKFVSQLINGLASLDENTALNLEKVLGVRAGFWLSLENDYQLHLARGKEATKFAEQIKWGSQFPVAAMRKLGWIAAKTPKCNPVTEILEYFAVASPEAWLKVWGDALSVSYRGPNVFSPKDTSVAAWLRYGQISAVATKLKSYDRQTFQCMVPNLRVLANQPDPNQFVPELTELCAECGVFVVFVPELPGTMLSGAAHWYNGKPIIQISLRYKTNDHLWFSFFHEMKHIISHSAKKNIYINQRDNDSEEERQANAFSRDTLIPPRSYEAFLRTRRNVKLEDIRRFASEIEIAPGIVVGRLQHDGYLRKDVGNGLKVSYEWS